MSTKAEDSNISDEDLFKMPTQLDECPICFLRMPSLDTGRRCNTCCGKVICSGCIHAGAMVGDDKLCPFCRAPAVISDEEGIERMKKRMEVGDPIAMHYLACGLPQRQIIIVQLSKESQFILLKSLFSPF